MAQKTRRRKDNQHFVPQFYLRNFAVPETRKRAVSLFRISRGTFVPTAPIEGQAAGHRFYQVDELDDMLTKVESDASRVIATAVDSETMPCWHSEEHGILLLFTVLQSLRTQLAAATMDEATDRFVKNLLPNDEKGRPELERLHVEHQNAPAVSLFFAADATRFSLDLRYKLLCNHTSIPLLTSDHPVVLYNQLLERKRVPGGITGFGCMGLQMFLPLSPRHLLLFYDGDTYKVGTHRHNVLVEDIKASADVKALNCLQAANAADHLYFNGHQLSEATVRQVVERAARFRRTKLAEVDSFFSDLLWSQPQKELVRVHHPGVRMHLNLQCVRTLPSALSYDPNCTSVHMRKSRTVQSLYQNQRVIPMVGETVEQPGAMLRALDQLRARLAGHDRATSAAPTEHDARAASHGWRGFDTRIRVSSVVDTLG